MIIVKIQIEDPEKNFLSDQETEALLSIMNSALAEKAFLSCTIRFLSKTKQSLEQKIDDEDDWEDDEEIDLETEKRPASANS